MFKQNLGNFVLILHHLVHFLDIFPLPHPPVGGDRLQKGDNQEF